MGERVLIHAAGSGVGTAAIQLVRAAGAFAYGTSRTPDKLEKAKQFGLTESVAVGGDPMTFADAVKSWTNDAGIDVILDLVGAAYVKPLWIAGNKPVDICRHDQWVEGRD